MAVTPSGGHVRLLQSACIVSAFGFGRSRPPCRNRSPSSTRARPSRCISAPASAAATTPMRASCRATWAGTFPAIRRVVPKNMAGGGGMRLANFLYNAAPKDGTVVRNVQPRHRFRAAARQQGGAVRRDAISTGSARTNDEVCDLRRLAHRRHRALPAGPGDGSSWSARPASAPTPTSFPRSPTACSAPNSRSSPAIPAATTSTSRWSARRCRAAAAGRGRA